MGKQSSRIYYNGKDHKDIYYNGKYHNAMYFKDQGGIIWQKLTDILTISGCCINSNNNNQIGINTIYPITQKLDAGFVGFVNNSGTPDTIISGNNRAFGIHTYNYVSVLWVSDNGKYWKRVYVTENVKWVYPCFNGFMYLSENSNVYKVLLNDNNELSSEIMLYENLKVPGSTGTYGKYKSHNGIWFVNGSKVQFINQGGILLEYDFGNDAELTINFTFESSSKNYVYIRGMIYEELFETKFTQYAILSCDETEIKLEMISGADSTADKYWIANTTYVIEKNNDFYFYKRNARNSTLEIIRTSDFSTNTKVAEWGESDYIQLSLIGGTVTDLFGKEINTIRFYPYNNDFVDSAPYYKTNENVLEIMTGVYWFDKYVSFVGETLNQYGMFFEATKYYTVIGNLSRIAIFLSDTVLLKETNGFAYFTDNIGVGVSYP